MPQEDATKAAEAEAEAPAAACGDEAGHLLDLLYFSQVRCVSMSLGSQCLMRGSTLNEKRTFQMKFTDVCHTALCNFFVPFTRGTGQS